MPDAWPPAFAGRLSALSAADAAELDTALAFPRMSTSATLAPRLGHAVGAFLPAAAHSALTSAVKLLRKGLNDRAAELEPAPLLGRLAPDARPWRGRRAAVLMTHDLDTPECVAGLDACLGLAERKGIAPIVHVLTHAPYRVDAGFLADLTDRGVEVGLHGATHDYAIGGRSSAAIRAHLERALAVFPFRPRWYRAPAFAVSARLVRELRAAGFRCDSSRTVYHPRYASCRTLLPYRAPGTEGTVYELPVAIEDSLMFRDWRLDAREALAYCERVLARALETGGLVVVDTHPSILARYPGFYPELLDRWAAHDDVWLASGDPLLAELDRPCVV